MARSGKHGFLLAGAAVFALLAAPLPVWADFKITIQITGDTNYGAGVTVTDGDSADLSLTAGKIRVVPGQGGLPVTDDFSGSIDVAESKSGPTYSSLSLNWFWESDGTDGGAVQIDTSADFYMSPTTASSRLISSVFGSIGSGSVTVQQWVDQGNNLFGTTPGPLVFSPGLQPPAGGFGPGGFTDTASVVFASAIPYSITDRLTFTLGPDSLTQGTLQSTVVPEPITMFLGGSGLLMLTYAARRRLFGR